MIDLTDYPRLRNLSLQVLAWCGLGLVAVIFSGSILGVVNWCRQRINSKIAADERLAGNSARLTQAAELIAESHQSMDRAEKLLDRDFHLLINALDRAPIEQRLGNTTYTDDYCRNNAVIRDGYIYPAGCKGWGEGSHVEHR